LRREHSTSTLREHFQLHLALTGRGRPDSHSIGPIATAKLIQRAHRGNP
jgi:hypothetical protein